MSVANILSCFGKTISLLFIDSKQIKTETLEVDDMTVNGQSTFNSSIDMGNNPLTNISNINCSTINANSINFGQNNLNYYREFSTYANFTIGGSSPTIDIAVRFVRVGKLVTCYIDGFWCGTGGSATNVMYGVINNLLPEFRPVINDSWFASSFFAQTGGTRSVHWRIDAGANRFEVRVENANYNTSTYVQFEKVSGSWIA